MEKRGQTTLFIILGIVIVLIAIVAILLITSQDTELSSSIILPEEVDNLRAQIESCSEDLAEGSLIYAGLHGGYSDITEIETYEFDTGEELGVLDIPYLYNEGDDNTILSFNIETQMENSILAELDDCIGFEDFSFIEYEKEDPEVNINLDDNVEIEIIYPVSVTFEEQSYDLEGYTSYEADVDLNYMSFVTWNIVNEIIEDPGYIPTSYILSTGLNIDYWNADDTTGVYIIQDDNSLINSESYLFLFAVKYEEAVE